MKWRNSYLYPHLLFPSLLTFLNFLIPFLANLEIISDSPWLPHLFFCSLIYYSLASDCAILNKVTNDLIIRCSHWFLIFLFFEPLPTLLNTFLKVASGLTLSWFSFGFCFHLILDLSLTCFNLRFYFILPLYLLCSF